MRNPLCLIGRHKWRTEYNAENEPYEVCARPRCQHYRNDSSVFDGPSPGPPATGSPIT